VASIVDICNLALSHLGNRASVVSISPVDGSVESDYCARFYQIARDEILEIGDWTFARTRAALVQLVTNPSSTWDYAYALPSDCLVPRRLVTGETYNHEDDSRDFSVEGSTLLTNLEDAELIYTRPIEDPTRFSPGFVIATSYKLAAYLAGPVLRGDAGAAAAGKLHEIAARKTRESMMIDGNREWRSDEFVPSMVAARGGYVPSTSSGSNPILYPGPGYAIS
jgi:hypothetical protein